MSTLRVEPATIPRVHKRLGTHVGRGNQDERCKFLVGDLRPPLPSAYRPVPSRVWRVSPRGSGPEQPAQPRIVTIFVADHVLDVSEADSRVSGSTRDNVRAYNTAEGAALGVEHRPSEPRCGTRGLACDLGQHRQVICLSYVVRCRVAPVAIPDTVLICVSESDLRVSPQQSPNRRNGSSGWNVPCLVRAC